jgi:RNA polymerase sigma-54 factor
MLKQYLHLKLSQKLSPQQIQVMKLLQLPTQAFEQRLKEELLDNPALEGTLQEEESYEKDEYDVENEYDEYEENESIDADEINIDEYLSDDETPDYKLQTNNYIDDDEKAMPLAVQTTFHQNLLNQLDTFLLSENEREIIEFLVGSIDDDGYLRRSIQDIVDDMAFTQGVYTDEKVVEKMLHIIQELEPIGIGARDLRECLLLQLKHKTPSDAIDLAIKVLEEQFEPFTKKQYDKLLTILEITQDQLRNAIEVIEKLNPKPGGSFDSSSRIVEQIVPDFTVRVVDGALELSLNGRNMPTLTISRDYQDMLKSYKVTTSKTHSQKDAVQFIKQKLDAAKWFIDAIRQRQETLLVTMNAIMHFQKEYFLNGEDAKMRPMILKDIADLVGLDISTVSRVANSKYVDTPYGTKLLKEFFSEAMKNDQGEDISTIEIKKILKQVVDEEDKSKPLPDEQLVEILKEKGYKIARRTISKYREILDIPNARMRKKI